MKSPRTLETTAASAWRACLVRDGLLMGLAPVIFGLSLLLGSVPAAAQNLPTDRASIVKLLDERFAEKPVALGLADNGGLIEVFASGDGSTWTMILSLPNGESRVLGEGSHWVDRPRARDEAAAEAPPML